MFLHVGSLWPFLLYVIHLSLYFFKERRVNTLNLSQCLKRKKIYHWNPLLLFLIDHVLSYLWGGGLLSYSAVKSQKITIFFFFAIQESWELLSYRYYKNLGIRKNSWTEIYTYIFYYYSNFYFCICNMLKVYFYLLSITILPYNM